jgi:HEAT repeat protein
MKSTNDQLKNRGFAFQEDLDLYKKCSENELLKLLSSKDAFIRTIAVKLLSENPKEKYIPIFIGMLKSGEKLYTKLELQNVLKEYSEKSIPYLIPLLGSIGKNQHKKIKIVDLNKKSYPCPRDIVAMILIRIGPKVFPEIKKLLVEDKNMDQIYEAIDVIGHITWNYKDYSMEDTLLEYYTKHKDNEFIEWKIIRAFQSFDSVAINKILEKVINQHKNSIIVEEAKRSKNRIESRI